MHGAVDLSACPTRDRYGRCRCKPLCVLCAQPEHCALHGPRQGEPPGSIPFDHEFAPVVEKRLDTAAAGGVR